MPVVCKDRFYGPDSAENRRVTQVQFLDMVICPLSSRTVEVPQIQLIARIWGHFLSPQRQVRAVQTVQFTVAIHRQGWVFVPVGMQRLLPMVQTVQLSGWT